jgi:hypothetical protein
LDKTLDEIEEGEANESSISSTWVEIKVMHEGRSYDVFVALLPVVK